MESLNLMLHVITIIFNKYPTSNLQHIQIFFMLRHWLMIHEVHYILYVGILYLVTSDTFKDGTYRCRSLTWAAMLNPRYISFIPNPRFLMASFRRPLQKIHDKKMKFFWLHNYIFAVQDTSLTCNTWRYISF